jgi:hypothetical protein
MYSSILASKSAKGQKQYCFGRQTFRSMIREKAGALFCALLRVTVTPGRAGRACADLDNLGYGLHARCGIATRTVGAVGRNTHAPLVGFGLEVGAFLCQEYA